MIIGNDQICSVTDGTAGFEAQAIAVAEAIGLPFVLKRVRIKGLLRLLPTRLQVYLSSRLLLRFVGSNEPVALAAHAITGLSLIETSLAVRRLQ